MTAGFAPPPNWTETSTQLRKSGQVTLSASGIGVLSFETDSSNQRWVITQIVITTNQAATATVVPQCTLALNTTDITQLSQGNTRGTSWSGNNDTFSASVDVGPMDYVSLLFFPPPGSTALQIAALSGVIAGATIQGTKYTPEGLMLTIPPWGLWMMMGASALGTLLLLMQLRAVNWRLS